MASYRLVITGKVQGVFYRQSSKERAQQLNIKGWVKNRPDGSVEMTIAGEEDDIKSFITWCRQGPPQAGVDNVQIEPTEETAFDNFSILRF